MPTQPDRARAQRLFDEAVASDLYRLRSSPLTDAQILEEVRLAHRHLAEAEWFVRQHHPIPESPFARAYDAIVVSTNALLGAYGYASSGEGGHEQAFQAASGLLHVLGMEDAVKALTAVRDRLRPIRHAAQYEHLDAVDKQTLTDAMELARLLVRVLSEEALARRRITKPDFGTFGLRFDA